MRIEGKEEVGSQKSAPSFVVLGVFLVVPRHGFTFDDIFCLPKEIRSPYPSTLTPAPHPGVYWYCMYVHIYNIL